MSLRTPSKDRRRPRLLCRGAKESYHRAEAACGWSLPACLTVKPVGEPDALIGHGRFDERGWETERCRMAQATAPILDSTETDMATAMRDVRSRGQSGKHLLAARISPFDPKQSWSAAAKRLDGIQKMSVHFAFEGHRLLLVNDLDLNRSFRLHMPTNCICPQQGVLHAARSKAREGRGQD